MLSLSLCTYQFRRESLNRVSAWFEHDAQKLVQVLQEDLVDRLKDEHPENPEITRFAGEFRTYLQFLASSLRVFRPDEGGLSTRYGVRTRMAEFCIDLERISRIYLEPYCRLIVDSSLGDAEIEMDLESVRHIVVNMVRNACEAVLRAAGGVVQSRPHEDVSDSKWEVYLRMFRDGKVLSIVVENTKIVGEKVAYQSGGQDRRGVKIMAMLCERVEGRLLPLRQSDDGLRTVAQVDIEAVNWLS